MPILMWPHEWDHFAFRSRGSPAPVLTDRIAQTLSTTTVLASDYGQLGSVTIHGILGLEAVWLSKRSAEDR